MAQAAAAAAEEELSAIGEQEQEVRSQLQQQQREQRGMEARLLCAEDDLRVRNPAWPWAHWEGGRTNVRERHAPHPRQPSARYLQ